MKRERQLLSILIAGMLLTFGVLGLAIIPPLLAESAGTSRLAAAGSAAGLSEAVAPVGTPALAVGTDETPPPGFAAEAQSPNVLPTPVPGETLVYFVPTDNDATATVLFLYNTDNVAHIVALRGFSYNGVLVYSLNINVGANSFLRMASDSIAAAPPPSWATPAPIITNFTDFTYFASLSLPKGVKAEGYVVFNPGTGTIDPRQDQGAIPLRFSTDPASVFVPAVQK